MKSRLFSALKLLNQTEKKVYETLILSIFTITFLSLFVLKPSVEVITIHQKKLSEAKKVNIALTEKIEALKKSEANLKIYKEEIDKMKIALPTNFNQSALLKSLSFLAADNQTTLIKTEFSEQKSESFLKTVAFSIEARGSSENIYSFLQNLAQEPRYIKINSVIMQIEKGIILAKTSVEVFYIENDKR
ncbi:MAG: type 4a pilus biogenesis protein PilO [bacterium]